MGNEYDWLDSYDSPRRAVTAHDEVAGWIVSAIAVVAILLIFGL